MERDDPACGGVRREDDALDDRGVSANLAGLATTPRNEQRGQQHDDPTLAVVGD